MTTGRGGEGRGYRRVDRASDGFGRGTGEAGGSPQWAPSTPAHTSVTMRSPREQESLCHGWYQGLAHSQHFLNLLNECFVIASATMMNSERTAMEHLVTMETPSQAAPRHSGQPSCIRVSGAARYFTANPPSPPSSLGASAIFLLKAAG